MIELIKEFGLFLRHRKKYWLAPIVVVLLLLGLVLVTAANPTLSPFIYALF